MILMTYFKRHKTLIFCAIFFFYFGCGITLGLVKMECDLVPNLATVNKKPTELNSVEYAVIVLSAPVNHLRRDAIRSTWKKLAANIYSENGERLYNWNNPLAGQGVLPDFIKLYFVIATKDLETSLEEEIMSEEVNNKDMMLVPDFKDSYKSLTDKMLYALKWVDDNLNNLKYVIKCDDDSFVRIDLIIRNLEMYAPSYYAPELDEFVSFKTVYKSQPTYKGVYWGYFNGRARVYLSGKWKEEDWFLCDNYLPYALGGGYVVSRSIVTYVSRNAEFLSKYNSEDVSMGVWTAALDGINRVHDTRFDTEWKSRGCSDNLLVRHKQNPQDMFQMYRSLIKTQGLKLCINETVDRKSYLYKWNVLPSQCCT